MPRDSKRDSLQICSPSSKKIEDGVLRCSTALDPRFKMLKYIAKSKKQAVWNLVQNLMKKAETDTCEEPAVKIPRKSSHAAMFNFGSDSEEQCSDNGDQISTPHDYELCLNKTVPDESDMQKNPLDFWKVNQNSYLRLCKLA